MQANKHLWIYVALIIACLQVSACSDSESKVAKIEHSFVEPIEGSELRRVTLTEKAMERLDINTAPVSKAQVRRSDNGNQRMVVPYAALIYDAHGGTWVYTSPKPRTFVRHRISVDYIEGDLVVMSDGPPIGTEVAVVGVAELYGIESGIGH